MKKIRFALSIAVAAIAGNLWLSAQVRDFKPVTEAMLRNPAAGDWLNWRRTDNAWGYSPLDQINKRNVQQLQLAWSWAMENAGAQEATPLVYNGVMYLPNPGGVIQALDGATGDLIWEYRPDDRQSAGQRGGGDLDLRGIQRNLAIFGDRIFGTTSDAHVIALDARTGKRVWDVAVADPKLGYSYTSGPIVVRGKVIAGMTGCSRYKDDVCFISAHDAATGKEVWRTSTIARPGEAGGNTWGDLPLNLRAGRRRVDSGQLRSGREPRLLGHRAGKAVGARCPRHGRRRSLHQLDARARSRHRNNQVALPASARRNAGHGRGVRANSDRCRRAASRSSRWASWEFSGSSIARTVRSSTPAISNTRTSST